MRLSESGVSRLQRAKAEVLDLLPSGQRTRIKQIVKFGPDLAERVPAQSAKPYGPTDRSR